MIFKTSINDLVKENLYMSDNAKKEQIEAKKSGKVFFDIRIQNPKKTKINAKIK